MKIFTELSQVIMIIGILAFLVSAITEALKKWQWFNKKVPTALVVIGTSLILCPITMLGMAAYYQITIEWYMVFASFIAAFVVALIAMDGWERVIDLANRFIKE